MKPTTVIYHRDCYDGFTAAWLLHQHFPDARYVGANYGDKGDPTGLIAPVGEHVLMVDFSFPRADLIRLAEKAESIVVLDHHKTAEENLRGLDFCEFDMERSGCQMAWDWLAREYPKSVGKRRHWLVEHVADRDLWRMALPQTPFVHAYYTSVPMTFKAWGEMANMGRNNAVKLGKAIRQSIDRYCEKVGAHAYGAETKWGRTVVVNAPYLNASELADWLLKQPGAPEWSVSWYQRRDGKIQYSLRSRGDFDVSQIAKSMGGGGHKNAAGFESHLAPWVWVVEAYS